MVELLLFFLRIASSSQTVIESIKLFLVYATVNTNAVYAASETILLNGFPIVISSPVIVNVTIASAGTTFIKT
jgi:hypothetical protein